MVGGFLQSIVGIIRGGNCSLSGGGRDRLLCCLILILNSTVPVDVVRV